MNEQQIKDLVTSEIDKAIAAHSKKDDWPIAMDSVLKPAIDGITSGIANGILKNVPPPILTPADIQALRDAIYAINYLYDRLQLPGTEGVIATSTFPALPRLPLTTIP